jgi:prolyl oligopeptidase
MSRRLDTDDSRRPARAAARALAAASLAAACSAPGERAGAPSAPHAPRLAYPETATVDVVDDYHGTRVADPYRWLEDGDSAATRDWVERQNALSSAWLGALPGRAAIEERLSRLWKSERRGAPYRRGPRWFATWNDGTWNQDVLVCWDPVAGQDPRLGPAGEPRVLVDPNRLSADGTVALAGVSPSDDGRLVAYATSSGGSDWQEWRVLDAASGTELADRLEWTKFTDVAWTADGAGFFYARYDAPPEGGELDAEIRGQKIAYHALGAPQSADRLVYERPDQPEWFYDLETSEDGRWLVITVSQGTDRTALFVADLADPPWSVRELAAAFDGHYAYVANRGETFLFTTDAGAPRGRLVEAELGAAEPASWRELIAERAATLLAVDPVGGELVASWLEDAHSAITIHAADGRERARVALPGTGTCDGPYMARADDPVAFLRYTDFTQPSELLRLDVARARASVHWRPALDFDGTPYVTRQVFCASPDGTRVPLFLTHRRGLELDGSNPVRLYGYGGFSVPITPAFEVATAVWLERGGVAATAVLRGGNEYGEAWHAAGTKLRKQNVFDDFMACAEWLAASGIARPERIAIAGFSNGGLLVGACLTQRPELFGAAHCGVGVLDMLRYQRFTIGWAWEPDYGTAEDPEEFRALYAYSPVHRARAGAAYPATLITTGDHDDRVVPAHSYKFAAALQAAQAGPAPILLSVETRAGHGAGKPVDKKIEETADALAFLMAALGGDRGAQGAADESGAPGAAP